MKFFDWMKENTKKLSMWDIAFIKWSALFFGLWIATVFPIIISLNPWVYFVMMILLAIKPF